MWSDANFCLHHTHSFIYPHCKIVFIVFVSNWCFLLSTAFIVIVIAACARSSTPLIVDCIVSHSEPQSILPVFSKVAPMLLETCHFQWITAETPVQAAGSNNCGAWMCCQFAAYLKAIVTNSLGPLSPDTRRKK
jgi:hypothetical protein